MATWMSSGSCCNSIGIRGPSSLQYESFFFSDSTAEDTPILLLLSFDRLWNGYQRVGASMVWNARALRTGVHYMGVCEQLLPLLLLLVALLCIGAMGKEIAYATLFVLCGITP